MLLEKKKNDHKSPENYMKIVEHFSCWYYTYEGVKMGNLGLFNFQRLSSHTY